MLLTSGIDMILEYLAVDERFHSIEEIVERTNVTMETCERIALFLSKYGFVRINKLSLQIDPGVRKFILDSSRDLIPREVSETIVVS